MSLIPARNRMGLLLTDTNSDFGEVPLTERSHATTIFKVVCHISDWFLCHCLWQWYWNRSRSKWVRARPVTRWDGSKIRVTIFIPPNPRPTALLLRCSMWVNELFQFWAVFVHIRPENFFMSTWKAIRHSVYIALGFPAHTTTSFYVMFLWEQRFM